MAQITWQEFSRRPEIAKLSLSEQKKRFIWENNQRSQKDRYLEELVGGPTGATSGIGSDGPLSGATVTARGVSVTTNALGEFTFPFELGPTEEITITGGTDSITGVAFEGELKGYITPTIKVVSPLTTLAYYDESASSFDAALDNVISTAADLGFTGISKDILTEDYIKKSVEENDDRAVALQAFTTYVDSIAEASAPALTGIATSRYGTPSTVKDVKVAMYKYFGRTKTISAKSFVQTEVTGEIDDTKNEIISNAAIAIETVLKTELTNVVKDALADANYRTTRIQGINRTIKRDIKTQVINAITSRDATTVKTSELDITTLLTTTQSDLTQIEVGVENKTDRVVDDSRIKSLVEVTSLFSELTGIQYIVKGSQSIPYQAQNLYALTTDLKVGTKIYVKHPEQDSYYSLDDAVTIDVKGTETKTQAWVFTNTFLEMFASGVTAILYSVDGNNIYNIDASGVITSIETR